MVDSMRNAMRNVHPMSILYLRNAVGSSSTLKRFTLHAKPWLKTP